MKKIIAVSQDPGGASAIAPVIKDLLQEGVYVIALNYGKGAEILEKQGVPLTSLKEFGIETPSENGFESSEPLETIIKKTNSDMVITGTGTPKPAYTIDRAAILASSKQQCPSISVLDLWQNYSERFQDPYTKKFIFPTKIAILDNIAKKSMAEEGFPEEILEVTGNPNFDSLAVKEKEFDISKREKLRKDLGVSNNFVIGFYSIPIEASFGNRYGFNERDSFDFFMKDLYKLDEKNLKQIKVLLKVHPREKPDSLDEIMKSYNGIDLIKNFNDTREVMLISDVNVSSFSTTLYESIAMNKIALAVQPNVSPENERMLFTYQFKDYIPILKKNSEIYEKIINLKNNPKYSEQMLEKSKEIKNDGKAKERVKNLVYRLL